MNMGITITNRAHDFQIWCGEITPDDMLAWGHKFCDFTKSLGARDSSVSPTYSLEADAVDGYRSYATLRVPGWSLPVEDQVHSVVHKELLCFVYIPGRPFGAEWNELGSWAGSEGQGHIAHALRSSCQLKAGDRVAFLLLAKWLSHAATFLSRWNPKQVRRTIVIRSRNLAVECNCLLWNISWMVDWWVQKSYQYLWGII